MHRTSLFLALAALPLAASAAPAKPAKLGQCVACHGENGRSRNAGTPHLAGQDEAYLIAALNAYRNGKRQAQPMNAIANTLQARDIAELARWYAQQAPAAIAKGAAR
jgi:cytochrome c553